MSTIVLPFLASVMDNTNAASRRSAENEAVNRLDLRGENDPGLRGRMMLAMKTFKTPGKFAAFHADHWKAFCMLVSGLCPEYQRWLSGASASRNGALMKPDDLLPPVGMLTDVDRSISWFAREYVRCLIEAPEGQAGARVVLYARRVVAVGRELLDFALEKSITLDEVKFWDLDELYQAELKARKGQQVSHHDAVDHAPVVARFEDGWTIERLISQKQFADEGNSMDHCVGGDGYQNGAADGDSSYWRRSRDGVIAILSLRTPEGEPQGTMEVRLTGGEDDDDDERPADAHGMYVAQYMAFSDDSPGEELCARMNVLLRIGRIALEENVPPSSIPVTLLPDILPRFEHIRKASDAAIADVIFSSADKFMNYYGLKIAAGQLVKA